MHVAVKYIYSPRFFYVTLAVILKEFTGKPKINEIDLRVFVQISIGIDHDVFELQIVISPLGAMNILEDTYQLVGNIDNFLDLLDPIKFREIRFEAHLVKRHYEESHQSKGL